MSWTLFQCQVEPVAEHNNWTDREKVTHLLAVLKRQAFDVLHSVPTDARYEDIVKDHYGDYQLAAAYSSQLKAKTQLCDEFQQDITASIEHLALRALVGLPQYFIHRQAAYGFVYRVRDREVKCPLLMAGERTLDEVLRLETAKAGASKAAHSKG
jgi:hypothetical protein